MKRLSSILFSIVLVPTAVSAEEQPSSGEDDRTVASAALYPAPTVAPQVRAPRTPTRAVGLRRRGSMVGYIEDAIIGSKLRLRFDAGLHNPAPDRAEFFYAKCGCYRDLLAPPDPNFDPDAPGPGPGLVTDLNFQQLYLQGEFAVRDRVSVVAEVPVRWIQPKAFAAGSFPNQSGIGDVRAGLKLALSTSDADSLTARVFAYVPTGSAEKGLGTDHASIEPALLYYHSISDRSAVEAQVGYWHPFGGSAGVPTANDEKFAGGLFFYGVGASYELYQGDRARFAPVVELVGWRVSGGFQTVPPPTVFEEASGINIVNLKIGGRITFDAGGSFYAGYGHRLTSDGWYDDIVRLEYRHSF